MNNIKEKMSIKRGIRMKPSTLYKLEQLNEILLNGKSQNKIIDELINEKYKEVKRILTIKEM